MDGQLQAVSRVQFYPDIVAGRHFRYHKVATRAVPVPNRVHVRQVPAWRHNLCLYGTAMFRQDGRLKSVQARFLYVKYTGSGVVEMRIVNEHMVKSYRLVSDHISQAQWQRRAECRFTVCQLEPENVDQQQCTPLSEVTLRFKTKTERCQDSLLIYSKT